MRPSPEPTAGPSPRAVAKAIAYHDCGKPGKAAAWGLNSPSLLDAKGILSTEWRDRMPE